MRELSISEINSVNGGLSLPPHIEAVVKFVWWAGQKIIDASRAE